MSDLMNVGMIAVHLPAAGMHHVARTVVEAVVPQAAMVTLATFVSLVEVVIAVAVLCYRARGNGEAVGGPQ